MPVFEIRGQNDGLNDVMSDLSGVECSVAEDMCRHEQAADTDVNTIIRRFTNGVVPAMRQVSFGDQDFELDLMAAYAAVGEVKKAWDMLPDEVRQKYGSIDVLLAESSKKSLEVRVEAIAAARDAAAAEVERIKIADQAKFDAAVDAAMKRRDV